MCAPFIPSWSFPSTVLKEMNTLPWLPRIFIGNWAAACYSCSWFYPATDPISGDWIRVELWQLDTRYVWFHPTTDSSSSGWKRVAADCILWLTWLDTSSNCLKLWRLDTSRHSGDWARNAADLYFNISSRFKDLLCKKHLFFCLFFFGYLPLNSVSTDSGPGYCFKNLKAAWRSLGKLEKASRL